VGQHDGHCTGWQHPVTYSKPGSGQRPVYSRGFATGRWPNCGWGDISLTGGSAAFIGKPYPTLSAWVVGQDRGWSQFVYRGTGFQECGRVQSGTGFMWFSWCFCVQYGYDFSDASCGWSCTCVAYPGCRFVLSRISAKAFGRRTQWSGRTHANKKWFGISCDPGRQAPQLGFESVAGSVKEN